MANSNYGYGTDSSQQPMREEVSFAVPASKCGIVIGRGGETIKLINQQSGAFCEMDRSAINPPNEKMFKMRGTNEQIEHARQLISEKIGVEISILSTRQIGGGNAPNSGQYGMQANNPGNMYNQQQQQQWGGYQQQMWDQSQQQMSASAAGQPDYSAQWIEYYKWVQTTIISTCYAYVMLQSRSHPVKDVLWIGLASLKKKITDMSSVEIFCISDYFISPFHA